MWIGAVKNCNRTTVTPFRTGIVRGIVYRIEGRRLLLKRGARWLDADSYDRAFGLPEWARIVAAMLRGVKGLSDAT